jgi:hypothetical protein
MHYLSELSVVHAFPLYYRHYLTLLHHFQLELLPLDRYVYNIQRGILQQAAFMTDIMQRILPEYINTNTHTHCLSVCLYVCLLLSVSVWLCSQSRQNETRVVA